MAIVDFQPEPTQVILELNREVRRNTNFNSLRDLLRDAANLLPGVQLAKFIDSLLVPPVYAPTLTESQKPAFNIPTLDVNIVITRKEESPTDIVELSVFSQLVSSPTYVLVRSIPTPDIPRRTNNNVAPVTRFQQHSAVSLAEAYKDRKLGCLLFSPISSQPYKIKQCIPEPIGENLIEESAKKFLNWLLQDVLNTTVQDIAGKFCEVSLLSIILNAKSPAISVASFFGCSIIRYYLAEQIATNVNATSIGVQSTIRSGGFIYEECDITTNPDQLDPELKENNSDSCFIPLRNLKDNLPGSEGFRTQLQIIFSDDPNKLNDVRQITIPSPIPAEQITKERILSTILGNSRSNKSGLKFGKVKYEVDVMPYGYLRFYGEQENPPFNNAKRLFNRISNDLINGSIDLDSFRASNRDRVFDEGNYFPVKAILIQFIPGEVPICTRWDLRDKE